jgi:alpha-aminoadipate carrier protein LysW
MESNGSCRLKNFSQNQRRKIMSTVTCPECEAEITLDAGTEAGEIIVCSDCGVDLEVIAVDPAAVQLAPMEQEDWGE